LRSFCLGMEQQQQRQQVTNCGSVLELKHAASDSVKGRKEEGESVAARGASSLKKNSSYPMANCRGRSRSNKRFLGVRQRPSGRWVAEIKDTTQKIRLWLGTFNCAEDAARAYDEAAWMLRGSNTRTNFLLPPPQAPSSSSANNFSLLPSKSARLLHRRRSSAAAAKLESTEEADAAAISAAAAAAASTKEVDASETDDSLTSTAFEVAITSGASETEDSLVAGAERELSYRSSSSSNTSSASDMISDSTWSYSSTEENLTVFPEMDHKEWLKAFSATEEQQQYLEEGGAAMMSDSGCSSSYRSMEESLMISFPEMPGNRKWLEPIRRERQYLETKPLQEDDDETSTGFVATAAEDSSDDLQYYTTSFDFSATDLEPLEKVPDTSSLEDPALSDDTMLLNEHFLRMKVQCSTPATLPVYVPNAFQECLLLSSLSFPAEEQGGGESSSHDQLIWNSWDLSPLCLVS
jgi:hypothetical protein